MRKKLLVGNWKMNKTIKECESFMQDGQKIFAYALTHNLDLGLAPTYLCLSTLKNNAPKEMLVFAQNVHYETNGAYTGEVSCEMLKEIYLSGSIIGHSERRTYDNETSLKCNLKIKSLLNNDLIPLYCVGETEKEFDEGLTYKVIEKQIKEGLQELNDDKVKKIIIAYEPIWSIGTGKNASTEIAENVCKFIRDKVREIYPLAAEEIRILYGGSVKPNNIKSYLLQKDIDGALVGGASLKTDSFSQMVHALID